MFFSLNILLERIVMGIKKDFGLRLKEIRSKKGITQTQLAEIVGIDPKHMSHIETGRSFPKADLIEKFAEALDIEYTEFFNIKYSQDRAFLLGNLCTIINSLSDKDLQKLLKQASLV